MSPSIPPTPADLERLAGLLRHELTGADIVVLPSSYSTEPRGAVRVRLGHRAHLDLADDGASWFVAGLWSDQGGETPPAERHREALAVPLQAEPAVVATAAIASVWRWVEAIGAQEADAPFTRTSRSAPPAIPGPAVFGAPAPAPYATAATTPYAPAAQAPYASAAPAPASSAAPGTAWAAPTARPRRRRKGLLIGGLVAAGLLVLTGGTVAAVAVAHTAADLASASSSPGGGYGETGGGTDDPGSDTGDTGSDPGATEDVPEISAFDLAVGDCFALGEGDATGTGEIDGVELQSCNDRHDNEAYLLFDATQASWPGERALWDIADKGCYEAFEAFVGIPWDESEADYAYLTPTEQSWSAGDREVLCYAWIEGDTSPGTLEGYGY